MLSAIFGAIAMVLGLIVDIITLPFRIVFVLSRWRRVGVPALQPPSRPAVMTDVVKALGD